MIYCPQKSIAGDASLLPKGNFLLLVSSTNVNRPRPASAMSMSKRKINELLHTAGHSWSCFGAGPSAGKQSCVRRHFKWEVLNKYSQTSQNEVIATYNSKCQIVITYKVN